MEPIESETNPKEGEKMQKKTIAMNIEIKKIEKNPEREKKRNG